MYSTVVHGHPTIIRHQIPQPKGVGVNSDAAKAFALSDEAMRLAELQRKGSYSVPVKIENSSEENDLLEVPNFIQGREKVLNNSILKEDDPMKFFKDNFSKDVTLLLGDLDNKKDKAERITVRIKRNFF